MPILTLILTLMLMSRSVVTAPDVAWRQERRGGKAQAETKLRASASSEAHIRIALRLSCALPTSSFEIRSPSPVSGQPRCFNSESLIRGPVETSRAGRAQAQASRSKGGAEVRSYLPPLH